MKLVIEEAKVAAKFETIFLNLVSLTDLLIYKLLIMDYGFKGWINARFVYLILF